MRDFDLFRYYQSMRTNQFILAFKGKLSNELMVNMGEILKHQLQAESGLEKTSRKVVAILIKLSQNIYRYSSEKSEFLDKDIGSGIILIQDGEEHVTVISGNLVHNQDAPSLIKSCEKINSFDSKKLKQYYREVIKLPRKEGQIGAGVGLIDVARKSGNPLEFNLTSIDEQVSFFMLAVKVDKKVAKKEIRKDGKPEN